LDSCHVYRDCKHHSQYEAAVAIVNLFILLQTISNSQER